MSHQTHMIKKSSKDKNNKNISKMDKEAKSFIDKILGDISKASASQQIVLGSLSGWLTGFLGMRVGKVVAVSVGGGIILLQIANEKGYIKVNWSKVNKELDKVADKVEEKVSGEGPSWMDKAERYVERKLDKAEEVLKNRQDKAGRWIKGDPKCQLKKIHIFVVSFMAGIAIGIATS